MKRIQLFFKFLNGKTKSIDSKTFHVPNSIIIGTEIEQFTLTVTISNTVELTDCIDFLKNCHPSLKDK